MAGDMLPMNTVNKSAKHLLAASWVDHIVIRGLPKFATIQVNVVGAQFLGCGITMTESGGVYDGSLACDINVKYPVIYPDNCLLDDNLAKIHLNNLWGVEVIPKPQTKRSWLTEFSVTAYVHYELFDPTTSDGVDWLSDMFGVTVEDYFQRLAPLVFTLSAEIRSAEDKTSTGVGGPLIHRRLSSANSNYVTRSVRP
jgi:hypothetical protein